MDNNRPFFSIVVSCYNSKRTLGAVLESLCNQELDYNDLEVIISDDCSTEPYDEITNQYLDRLNLKFTKTKYNCCPGNTREAGARIATGQWLGFSDHDDEFVPNGLSELKKAILSTTERYYIVTSFFSTDRNQSFNKEYKATHSQGWTHGKFYNLDNLWKKYDIHYKKDLLSHEDIYLTSTVLCILDFIHHNGEDAGTYFDDLFTYIWYSHPESVSHEIYKGGVNFLEAHFNDYLISTGYTYIENYHKGIIDFERAKQYVLDTIIIVYFYMESFVFCNPNNRIKENDIYIERFLEIIKKEFDLTNKAIYMHAATNRASMYNIGYESAKLAIGGVIPHLTFSQWLNEESPEENGTILSSPFYVEESD